MHLLKEYFEEICSAKDPLQNWRKKAWDRFQEVGWPRAKQEAFQYLSFQNLSIPKPAEFSQPNEVRGHIHFVDGYFQTANLPSPLICLSLDEALPTYGIFLQNRWTRGLKEESDPLAILNGAFQGKGAFLYVPPQCHVEVPIELFHEMQPNKMGSPRLHIYLNQQAKMTLLHKIDAKESSLINGFIDVVLDEGAQLDFQQIGTLDPTAQLLQTFRGQLKQNSRLNGLFLSQGASLSRESIKVQLLGEQSEVALKGFTDLTSDLQHHTHIVVEHVARNCKSHQHFKTALRETSRSSFEGKIVVRDQAEKTEGYQLNNNLLLSDQATAYSKPNLEIFASDVKASHGATMTQIDEEELFYLRSRGLGREEAKQWLIDGFKYPLISLAHPLLFHA
jgi:Fe-S cluster assembly protein SufD